MSILIGIPFFFQLILLLLPVTLASLAGLRFVRRKVDHKTRFALNEVAGANFAVLGGIYGVVLAFVLVGTWDRFQEAKDITEVEANSVADLSRLALSLGMTQTSQDCRQYMETVIHEEWKAMDSFTYSQSAQGLLHKIRVVVFTRQPTNEREQALFPAMLTELNQVSDARLDRLSRMSDAMPVAMWLFILPVGGIVVAYSYLFGLENGKAHMFITGTLAFAIAYSLLIILNLQHPFSGAMKVTPEAYENALATQGWEKDSGGH